MAGTTTTVLQAKPGIAPGMFFPKTSHTELASRSFAEPKLEGIQKQVPAARRPNKHLPLPAEGSDTSIRAAGVGVLGGLGQV